jgi:hypothetical protein
VRLPEQPVENWQVEAQAFSGSCPCGDHEVLVPLRSGPTFCLMSPQGLDALGCERIGKLRVQVGGEGRRPARPPGQNGADLDLGKTVGSQDVEKSFGHGHLFSEYGEQKYPSAVLVLSGAREG